MRTHRRTHRDNLYINNTDDYTHTPTHTSIQCITPIVLEHFLWLSSLCSSFSESHDAIRSETYTVLHTFILLGVIIYFFIKRNIILGAHFCFLHTNVNAGLFFFTVVWSFKCYISTFLYGAEVFTWGHVGEHGAGTCSPAPEPLQPLKEKHGLPLPVTRALGNPWGYSSDRHTSLFLIHFCWILDDSFGSGVVDFMCRYCALWRDHKWRFIMNTFLLLVLNELSVNNNKSVFFSLKENNKIKCTFWKRKSIQTKTKHEIPDENNCVVWVNSTVWCPPQNEGQGS